MTKQEKYGYWLMLSNYDLGTIDCLAEGRRWVYVAYLCQQALERQLKGMFVYYNDAEAPKTHNVNFLLSKVMNSARFAAEANMERFAERRADCEDFLADVMFYYMSDYPFSYKNISSRFVDAETALELRRKTLDFITWLRSFQPKIVIPKTLG
jgi:HEPN domain-containing protein